MESLIDTMATITLSPTQIIAKASQILNHLAEQNITNPEHLDRDITYYIDAKIAFIDIAEKFLVQSAQPLETYFINALRDRIQTNTISTAAFTILCWDLDPILANFQQCLKDYKQPLKEKVLSRAVLATDIECAICLLPHKKIDTLCIDSCQHEFGKECLLEWQNVSKQCPLCRADAVKIHGYKARKSAACKSAACKSGACKSGANNAVASSC